MDCNCIDEDHAELRDEINDHIGWKSPPFGKEKEVEGEQSGDEDDIGDDFKDNNARERRAVGKECSILVTVKEWKVDRSDCAQQDEG